MKSAPTGRGMHCSRPTHPGHIVAPIVLDVNQRHRASRPALGQRSSARMTRSEAAAERHTGEAGIIYLAARLGPAGPAARRKAGNPGRLCAG